VAVPAIDTNNDIPGLTVTSIQIQSSQTQYDLKGNGITLAGNTTVSDTSGVHFINLPIDQEAVTFGTFIFFDHVYDVGDGASLVISGQVTGGPQVINSLHKTGNGELLLSNQNDFGDSVQIDQGKITLENDNALALPSNTQVAVTVAAGATLDLFGFNATIGSLSGAGTVTNSTSSISATLLTGLDNTSTTFDGVFTASPGNINLVMEGTGTFTLGAANSFAGTIGVAAGGTLALGADGAIPIDAPVDVGPGATLDLGGHDATLGQLTGAGTVTSSPSATLFLGLISNDNFDGVITGNISLDVTTKGNPTFTLNGVNTFTGNLSIHSGTVAQGVDFAIPPVAVQVDGGATLDLNAHQANLGSLSGSGTVIYDPLPMFVTLTTGLDNTSTTFDGVISGNINLVKDGIGTFTLTGANTYTGQTSILRGTLQVTGSLSPSATVTVAVGAMLTGTATVANVMVTSTNGNDTFVIDTTGVTLNGTPIVTTLYTTLTVNGQGGSDTFDVRGTNTGSTTILNAGGGSSTLIGPNVPNVWQLTSPGGGTVGSVSFTHMAILRGGSSTDTFVFQPGGSVSMQIDGGGGSNTLDYSADGGAGATVNLQTQAASRINGGAAGGFKGIQHLVGSSGAGDLLVGPDGKSTWFITGANAGSVGGFTFTGVKNLRGGSQNDVFRFSPAGTLQGFVDGGGGRNALDYSFDGGVAATVNLQTHAASRLHGGLIGGFVHIQAVVGSTAVSDRLIGPDSPTLWQIAANNAGMAGPVAFAGIKNLQGGSASDTFKFSPAGFISGAIVGGGGGDWLDYSLFTTAVSVNLATGVATHVAGGAPGKINQIQNVIGGAGNDTLIGNALGNILIGGAGTNVITSGNGRNLLIGGTGKATITAGSADDILIAGTTTFDANKDVLMAILKEWQRTDKTYAQRIADLKNGGGFNGANKLVLGSTVLDNDTSAAHLIGGAGLDWFFANLGPGGVIDTITNRKNGEQVN
jgi:autotransporter-associated beta strand protein